MASGNSNRRRAALWGGLGLLSLVFTTGCQVDVGGQTLPSPYYMQDDVQHFAPGPEFKLSNEAAEMKRFKAARASESR